MQQWQGQTAWVTGGGSGIGKALALALAQRGVDVHVVDINWDAAQSVAQACGPGAKALELDVRDAEKFGACLQSVFAQKHRLDYLFNNAGIGVGGECFEIPVQMWDHIIDINIRGVVNGIAAAYPLMVKQGHGHIINTASLGGLGPAPLLTPYALTKHAIVGLSTSLRIEAAALGVRVSVLCPAAIETPLLDSENPAGFTQLSWRPDMRRFLTKLAGPPYPADKLAAEALAAIERNVGIIVLPGKARILWRLGRFFPGLVEKVSLSAVAAERAQSQSAQSP